MSLPKTMKAYKCVGEGRAEVQEVPLPTIRPDYVLVRVSAVALNPTDWKHIHGMPSEGATVGCDFAGTIEEVGPEVQKSFKRGDRVAGIAHGVNEVQPEDGSFAEYIVAKGDLVIKIPDAFSDEEASTLGVGVTTVGQSLYQSLKLPMPDHPAAEKTPVLIYGGSTATGLFALQYAKLSGFTAVATCSPKNFELVKRYGADAVFDYSDLEKCSSSIREYTNNALQYAFDTISTPESAKICAGALSSAGSGKYSNLLPLEFPRKDVEAGYTLAYTALGESFEFRGGKKIPASSKDFEFGKRMWKLTEQLLAERKVNAPPMDVRSGGLSAIGEGLNDLKENRVSGKKIVFRIAGTL